MARKTINSIFEHVDNLMSAKDKDPVATVRGELFAYYSTPEGRAEIDNSPNRHFTTEEAVSLLMVDIEFYHLHKLKKAKNKTYDKDGI